MKLDSSAFLADPQLIRALGLRAIELSCGAESVLFHQETLLPACTFSMRERSR